MILNAKYSENLYFLLEFQTKKERCEKDLKKLNLLKEKNANNGKNEKKVGIMKDNFEFALLALPGFILFLIFNYLPMYGVIIAFKKFNPNLGIWKSQWNGFKNFEFFFTSQDAITITRNTVLYNSAFIILDLIFAVTLALMFYNLRNRWALKTYHTIVVLPKFLSAVLIAFIAYAVLNARYGMLNAVIEMLGGAKIDWYSKPEAWPIILTVVHLWQYVGNNSILYYAQLMSIDDSLFEAARIDGANKLQMTFNICIPHLKSVMIITTILAVGGIFGGDFGLFYQVPQNIGTLYPTTDIIPTYVFRGLKDGNLAMSAAVGLFQSLVGMILVITTNAIVRKISPENSLF